MKLRTLRHKKAIAPLALLIIFALGVTGCGLANDAGYSEGLVEPAFDDSVDMEYAEERAAIAEDEMLAAGEAPMPQTFTSDGDVADVAPQDRLVILNRGMRVEVEKVDGAIDDIRTYTSAAGGTITSLNISTDVDGPIYRYEAEGTLSDGAPLAAYMTVRVPADRLEGFIEDVSALGEVLREYASEQDVTQQHIDLSARLANLQAQEERLREFFDRATNVEEMLAIESQLSRVRGDIESMQAQVDYLERQAAMATITIELTEPKSVVRPAGESWGFVEALTTAVRAFVGTINGMIVFVGAILPIAVLALIAFLVIRAIVRRRSAGKPAEDAEV